MTDTHDDAAWMFAREHGTCRIPSLDGTGTSGLLFQHCTSVSAARLARASNAFRCLRLARSTAENVVGAFSSGVIGDIPADRITGMTPFTRELLARAQYAVAEGRDLRAGELGDLFVCTPAARSVKVRSKACVRAVAQF
ncbi:MAG: hypothetical protein J7463_14865 [Roseiflexus sp.]|jgi:hypothetical protein|nr:hypothetical protein [Roseiflexus sp.]